MNEVQKVTGEYLDWLYRSHLNGICLYGCNDHKKGDNYDDDFAWYLFHEQKRVKAQFYFKGLKKNGKN